MWAQISISSPRDRCNVAALKSTPRTTTLEKRPLLLKYLTSLKMTRLVSLFLSSTNPIKSPNPAVNVYPRVDSSAAESAAESSPQQMH